MKVDLPAPLSPSSASTSPDQMSRLIPDKAVSAPNRLETLRAVRSGTSAGAAGAVISSRRQPAEQVLPQFRVTRPVDEGLGQPVRADVGCPNPRSSLAETASDQKRVPSLVRRNRSDYL